MDIITGYKGEAHITSQMDRDINRGIFGDGAYVANLANGDTLTAAVASANQIVIGAGLIVAQGCAAEIPHGTSEVVTIANGTQLMKRRDLIVAQYTRADGIGVESMALRVIKGTPAASNPERPGYNGGTIVNGSRVIDFPLFEVFLDGLTIERIERLAPVVDTMGSIDERVTGLESDMEGATLIRREFPFTVYFTAGNPGTFGAKVNVLENYKEILGDDSLVVVGMYIASPSTTYHMHLSPGQNGNTIYVLAYRASSAAVEGAIGTLVVTFKRDI